MDKEIEIREMTVQDCTPSLLDGFERRQEVNRCWRREAGGWALKDIHYIERWDEEKKRAIAELVARCLRQDGKAAGAFGAAGLVGFTCVEAQLFGSQSRYANLDMIHVSEERRGEGIGRRLFAAACMHARGLGAEKLYISAHSAEEPMAFYRKLGCVDALEVNRELAEKEPCDCQLEYVL